MTIMSKINGFLMNRITEYIMSCGFTSDIAEFHVWNTLSYSNNKSYVVVHSDTMIPDKMRSNKSGEWDLFCKLSMYNPSVCIILVVLKAIGYGGDVLLKLTTDHGNKLIKEYRYDGSDVIDDSTSTSHTSIDLYYFTSMCLFGTPKMLSEYMTELIKFPQKAESLAKSINSSNNYRINDNIHNIENRMLFIRFMNEYDVNSELELLL